METIVVGAALFAALLVTFGVLRARVRDVSRAVEELRIRIDALSAIPAGPESPAIDVEPFVD